MFEKVQKSAREKSDINEGFILMSREEDARTAGLRARFCILFCDLTTAVSSLIIIIQSCLWLLSQYPLEDI